MKKFTNFGCGTLLALMVGFLIVVGIRDGFGGASQSNRAVYAPNSVRLHAASAYIGGNVTLWDEVREGPDVGYTNLPGGTRCVRLSGPVRLGSGDTALYFYKLDCGGTIGYVNEKLIR